MQFVQGPDAVLAQKLGELVSDLYMSTDESDIRRLWTSAHRMLLKSKADPGRVEAVMKARRAGALATLVKELEQASRSPLQRLHASPQGAQEHKPQSAVGVTNPAPAAPESSVPAVASDAAPASTAPASPSISQDQLKSAMKAFRKRLKLTRLDDESRLGNRAMTGGRQSQIVAILPPREYPPAVWEELAKQGKLREAGSGFFELIGD